MTTAVTAPVVRMVRSLPAAVRIRALRHVGLTDPAIAARAHITSHQLRRAVRGDLIGWDVERRLLALPIPNEASLYEEIRRPIGARRRIRALRALGWPLRDLAAALDWPVHKLGAFLDIEPVYVIDHLTVCALYDQRWSWAPEDHGVPTDEAEQARLTAQLGQCHSPLVWDDDTIDDPRAQPSGRRSPGRVEKFGAVDPAAALRALDGDRVRTSGHTRTHAIAYGARYLGMPIEVIAERLGMELDAAQRSWERIKNRARANGETWPNAPRFTDEPLYLSHQRQRAA
ncbi:hypothetical protein [Streptomyces scabiei]|uniref:hypothetical protein n=1 Tax=Streptomyces scabiei TaxID=1930 RepID=UPI0029A7249F|nr:hypothetical protein [Streptomyces scabiei]MDX3125339.1 hypothetical protein [Streptomyces scabiei]MDX3204101.1 hypothetical protein [Streptomyces scabiei]MDX3223164.1 hypothetical protein [Streptomyces scabiei]